VTELIEQQTAISEVLRAIASSPDDLQPVFDAILDGATRLCQADIGSLRLFEKDGIRLVSVRGNIDPFKLWPEIPVLADRNSFLSTLASSRSPTHVANVAEHEVYIRGEPYIRGLVDLLGLRTMLVVPMLKDDQIIGTAGIARTRVQPFTNRQITLFTDFAAQATIALESTRRERQLREMQSELAHANRVATMGQLTASIVHEIKQPIAAARTNAAAALRFFDKSPPDAAKTREVLTCIVDDADRAGDVIDRIGCLIKKVPPARRLSTSMRRSWR
jgi:GAF domain-containing protein